MSCLFDAAFSFERTEPKAGGREVHQQYWRIDFKQFLDTVTLRIHRMKAALHQGQVERVTTYICMTCEDRDGNHPTWDELEAQKLMDLDTMEFSCPQCANPLDEHVNDEASAGDIMQRLQSQLLGIQARLLNPKPKTTGDIMPRLQSQLL